MQTIELRISGMTCGSCVSHVTKALQSAPGVQSAVVDLASATAHIQGESLDKAALVEAVEAEGYGAQESQNTSLAPSTSIPLISAGCSCCG